MARGIWAAFRARADTAAVAISVVDTVVVQAAVTVVGVMAATAADTARAGTDPPQREI